MTFQFGVERAYRRVVIEFQYQPLWCETGTPQMEEMMRQALKEQIMRQDEPFVKEVRRPAPRCACAYAKKRA